MQWNNLFYTLGTVNSSQNKIAKFVEKSEKSIMTWAKWNIPITFCS